MNTSTRDNIVNFVLFQVGWFACVLGAANQQGWVGVVVVAGIVILHIWRAQYRLRELQLLIVIGLLGYLWESVLRMQGVLVYADGTGSSEFAPVWMAALWINFAATLNLSLRWFQSHKWLAAVSAAIAGPLAYFAGERLGAIGMPDFWLAMVALSLGWAVLFPLALTLAQHFRGFPAPSNAESLVVEERSRG